MIQRHSKLNPGAFKRIPKPAKKSAPPRITAATLKRDAKNEAKAKLLESLHPSRSITGGLLWVAIISKPSREHRFAADLEARTGAFCVIPMYDAKPRRKHGGASNMSLPNKVPLPLLPRVVFAGYETPPNWLKIERVPNYSGRLELVIGKPAYIPAIEVVRLRDETERVRRQVTAKKMAAPGALIQVSGYDGVDRIDHLQGKYAILERMMLGQNVRVELGKFELLEAA